MMIKLKVALLLFCLVLLVEKNSFGEQVEDFKPYTFPERFMYSGVLLKPEGSADTPIPRYKGEQIYDFLLDRKRVGYYWGFPRYVSLRSADKKEVPNLLGKEALIIGYIKLFFMPILEKENPDVEWLKKRESADIGVIDSEIIIPVQNQESAIFSFEALPETLENKDYEIKFKVKNILGQELIESELIVDLEGTFILKEGKPAESTHQYKHFKQKFDKFEEKQFSLQIVPWQPIYIPDRNKFVMSFLFMGYALKGDEVRPVYAFWKKVWPIN
ncbi:MAG: hypothetical protein Q8O13_07430 [Candidatus Omnitrophota bacterium]|nr:hypothetical protein [Candidatus Omnitrophota bacterium]